MMRSLLLGILFIIPSKACLAKDRPIVGAIRWDAWTGGHVTEQVERTLGLKKYHHRLPWFAEIVDGTTVKINGGRQEVMDQEIVYAANTGIDYWAFLAYPKDSSMSTAFGQYLNSPKREQVRFCLIMHNNLMVPDGQWPEERDRAVALLKEPGYQTVLADRPLVYAFTGQGFPFNRYSEFLTVAKERGVRPYSVFMGWHPASDIKKAKPNGFDAVSSYARPGSQTSFVDLAKATERDCWENAAYAKAPYVPLVTTGWDKNPRKDNPVSWEKGSDYHRQTVFPSKAEPVEIAKHLQNAMTFVRKHSDLCETKAVIIYAWNEYDEGGWLAPTRGLDGKPNVSRLDAIQKVLKLSHEYTPNKSIE